MCICVWVFLGGSWTQICPVAKGTGIPKAGGWSVEDLTPRPRAGLRTSWCWCYYWMLNVKKMSSPEGKISWCLWWCWMWRRCRGNARADDNVTSSQAYLHLRPSPLAPFFNASHGWVCRKDVTFFGISRRLYSIVGPKNHALMPQIFIVLLSPSGDLGISLVWHNLSPPDPTTATFRSDCWNPLQTELNHLWWVLSCS